MNKAVYYEPSNYKAWRNKGSLHLRQGKTSLALNALNKSIALYPYSKSFFTRALLYHQLKKFPQAISDLEKVIEQEPDNARAYYILGDCQEQLNQTTSALANYNKAILHNDREPLFFIRRGMLYAKTGNKQYAYNDLDKAVSLRSGNGEAHYYRAMMRYSLGESPCSDLKVALSLGYEPARGVFAKICK
jgi:tetratricopeptide (TPR) repeat protein